MVQTNQETERELPFQEWCFGLVFRRQDDKGPVVVLEGGVEVVMLSQGRASSETPEAAAASQWYVDSTQSHSLFCKGGSCVIEPITKDPLEGVLF